VGAELVAAFRRDEPPGAGGRDVCLSGNVATKLSRRRPVSGSSRFAGDDHLV
jgi:hypothetical protein